MESVTKLIETIAKLAEKRADEWGAQHRGDSADYIDGGRAALEAFADEVREISTSAISDLFRRK